MGQHLARRDIREGLRLYAQQQPAAAVKKWRRALQSLAGSEELQFRTLAYLVSVHSDTGHFRDMLACGVSQLQVARNLDSPELRAEAYLTLARSHYKLCEYSQTVAYCKHSLHNQNINSKLIGYVFLTRASALVGLSRFTSALTDYDAALAIAHSNCERDLQLRVLSGLGQLFTSIRDYQQGMAYHLQAARLAKSFQVCDVGDKLQRQCLLNLAQAYLHMDKLQLAIQCCQVFSCLDVHLFY